MGSRIVSTTAMEGPGWCWVGPCAQTFSSVKRNFDLNGKRFNILPSGPCIHFRSVLS